MPDSARLTPGTIVRHFKRELEPADTTNYLYHILGFGTHSESRERYVVYRGLYGDKETYVRPYDMFMSEVDREKYPDIKQVYRFEPATASDMVALIQWAGSPLKETLTDILLRYI